MKQVSTELLEDVLYMLNNIPNQRNVGKNGESSYDMCSRLGKHLRGEGSNSIKVVQLSNIDGNPAGLYIHTRDVADDIQTKFDVIFEEGRDIEQHEHESGNDDWDLMTYVDEKLESLYGIVRIYADDVTTNVI